ncbi:hypothetical protein F4604DRAFT_1939208 [Suillus subluteus]|nr:hypothetical protein F4604DRAFT_1939208 [Suillus subluteus]
MPSTSRPVPCLHISSTTGQPLAAQVPRPFGTSGVQVLRREMTEWSGLTALLGTLEGRGGNFPWKTLPTVLARRSCILRDYPDNILMPGEKRATLARSKGINDLSLDERRVLANALKKNALTVESTTTLKACNDLMLSRAPVILGEAPVGDPLITRGRRKFANGRIDRLGLACPGDISPSIPHPTPSRRQRCRVFIEVPLPPRSWRLNATRQRSPVLSTNHHGNLIPQIASVSLHAIEAVEDGVIEDEEEEDEEDEEEVDELLGMQESDAITPVIV